MVTPDTAEKFVLADASAAESSQIVNIGLEDQEQVPDGAFRHIQRNRQLSAAHACPDDRKNSLCTFKIREGMPICLKIGNGGSEGQQERMSFLEGLFSLLS